MKVGGAPTGKRGGIPKGTMCPGCGRISDGRHLDRDLRPSRDVVCMRCGHVWESKLDVMPKQCGLCLGKRDDPNGETMIVRAPSVEREHLGPEQEERD